jgi:thiol-disulfide isomerase/thioredoxin
MPARRLVVAASLTGMLVLAVPARAAEPVVLESVDHAGVVSAVKAALGTVVVLDCWSTSCPPCVKEFPRLVALQRKYGREVTCLSLSLDYEGIGTVEEVLPPVKAFLESQQAGFRNLLASEDSDTMCRKLGIVSVPAVFVWGRDGAIAKRFDDDSAAKTLGRPFTYDDIEAVVKECLAR